MKSVKVNAYAKVNLFLDVHGVENGYHQLDTVVTSISLCDTITVTKRKDNQIVAVMRGAGANGVARGKNNNAVKAAEAFFKHSGLIGGVDITITKRIPIGGGLGGSSADIAGTLIAMQSLFGTQCNLKAIADSLGSDSGYMLSGGWARLKGRGEAVERLPQIECKLNILVVTATGGCSTTECFKLYDKAPQQIIKDGANRLIDRLINNDTTNLECYNALYQSAIIINPQIKALYDGLMESGALKVFMSGSGSSVCAIFKDNEQLLSTCAQYKAQGFNAYAVQTLTDKEVANNLFV
jgi:4-diphosphocytidyl-2C-methyl-D-erythritol kinase